ncbi:MULTISPECIES: SPOR domain-containing protein [Legionella]|uniref:SPOR domain-containing protein n=1 Tax=Legionella maceachernii TaxID=466 RepID=A0A0W0W0T5_9GAMM|nr:SPOR domain-containing protein [Legionella maceachernii]KTD25859.1 hypothetical protein Lmac_1630 [Legionella maceachernii]SJZ47074.1 Sporulation related domain-containing protein [Legionella maceachernii]SUP03937.1 Uncharacterized protein conserved in bacteria [Legionella maceachernii]
MKKVRILVVCFCASGLTACLSDHQNYYSRYTSTQPYMYQNTQFYPQTYDGTANYGEFVPAYREVSVPDSYYAGSYRSPTSHKDLDRNWVSSQNPNGYTIELGESEKASQVAGKLYKAPKNNRMAEVKYNRGGKNYYKGVYGSYSNYEEAQKALNNLPPELKQSAGIKNWGSIQENAQ